MEVNPPRRHEKPPAYIAHNPHDFMLPSVPQTELSQPHVQAEITLPHLRTVLSPQFEPQQHPPRYATSSAPHDSPRSMRSLPPIDPGTYAPRRSTEQAVVSPSEAGSVMSIDETNGRSTSAASMDDAERIAAASALAALGDPNFHRASQHTSVSHATPTGARERPIEPEPILQLFTKAHPWVGGTINGSLSAYSTTKYYSPAIVRHSAETIERNIGAPMVNAVASVGRITGVESGLRWYYGSNAERQDEMEGTSNKRRRRENGPDLENGHRAGIRRDSEDLPPYGTSKPPSYREEASPQRANDRPGHNRSFSNQVIVTTSSLGAALSVTSRRSLRLCLQLLEHGAQRTQIMMNALSLVLAQYDEARESYHQRNSDLEKGNDELERPKTPDQDDAARRLAAIIKQHSDDIWQTIQTVVNNVSNSAGAALPDNARIFVRNQLMSLPQRWRWVSDRSGGLESETSRSAHRMVAFAREGLDMMGQVSEAFRVTLVGAEQWLERAGRRDPEAGMYGTYYGHGDVKEVEMGDVPTPYEGQHVLPTTEKQ